MGAAKVNFDWLNLKIVDWMECYGDDVHSRSKFWLVTTPQPIIHTFWLGTFQNSRLLLVSNEMLLRISCHATMHTAEVSFDWFNFTIVQDFSEHSSSTFRLVKFQITMACVTGAFWLDKFQNSYNGNRFSGRYSETNRFIIKQCTLCLHFRMSWS